MSHPAIRRGVTPNLGGKAEVNYRVRGEQMKYCDNIYCDTPEEPIERISDYRIIDGAVVCTYCYELEQDAQAELAANQADFD